LKNYHHFNHKECLPISFKKYLFLHLLLITVVNVEKVKVAKNYCELIVLQLKLIYFRKFCELMIPNCLYILNKNFIDS